MKISELIQKLEAEKAKHGDVVCIAFQHPEEDENVQEISSVYFHQDEQRLHVS
jgi:predicted CopG family antitoxin